MLSGEDKRKVASLMNWRTGFNSLPRYHRQNRPQSCRPRSCRRTLKHPPLTGKPLPVLSVPP